MYALPALIEPAESSSLTPTIAKLPSLAIACPNLSFAVVPYAFGLFNVRTRTPLSVEGAKSIFEFDLKLEIVLSLM